MKKIFFVGLMIVLLFGVDGNQLYKWGMEYDKYNVTHKIKNIDIVSYSMYIAYLGGVLDSYTGILICPPNNADATQFEDLVFKYLREHPEERNIQANIIIVKLLPKSWQCEKHKKNKK